MCQMNPFYLPKAVLPVWLTKNTTRLGPFSVQVVLFFRNPFVLGIKSTFSKVRGILLLIQFE